MDWTILLGLAEFLFLVAIVFSMWKTRKKVKKLEHTLEKLIPVIEKIANVKVL